MFFKKMFSLITTVSLVTVALPFYVSAEEYEPGSYIENEIIISTDKEIEEIDGIFSSYETSTTVGINFEKLGIEDISENTVQDETDTTCYVAEICGDVEKTCEKLNRSAGIIAEPNRLLETYSYTPPSELNGTFYNNNEKSYFGDILHFPSVWSQYDTTGEGVLIAVIDNGFNVNHVDFPVNLWLNSRGTPGWYTHSDSDDISFAVDSNGNTFSDSSHGTNVACIIGMPPNGRGGIGGAFGSSLMLLRVGYTSTRIVSGKSQEYIAITVNDLVSSINYAVSNGADIINMSLGMTGTSTAVRNAVNNAYNNGVALFAAAGNGDSNGVGINSSVSINYPAGYPNVIGVMATQNMKNASTGIGTQSTLSVFSNYDVTGNYYDIAAPGVSILGGSATNGSYTLSNGTSQATPLVVSGAALYLSLHPDCSVDDLYEAIKESSTDLVSSNPTAVPNNTYYFKSFDPLKLLAYQKAKTPPTIELGLGVSYFENSYYLQGFSENFDRIEDYITVSDGYYDFTPTALGKGTGSTVNVYYPDGEPYQTLYVLIYGDLNGDCICDGQDAVLLNCLINHLGSWDELHSLAGDVDFSGRPDNNDLTIIRNYAVKTDYVIQSR